MLDAQGGLTENMESVGDVIRAMDIVNTAGVVTSMAQLYILNDQRVLAMLYSCPVPGRGRVPICTARQSHCVPHSS